MHMACCIALGVVLQIMYYDGPIACSSLTCEFAICLNSEFLIV